MGKLILDVDGGFVPQGAFVFTFGGESEWGEYP
jgi:hypothetical protein